MATHSISAESAANSAAQQDHPLSTRHADFTRQRMPTWLLAASDAQRRQLSDAIARSERSKRQVRQTLAGWQGLKAFAEPLLAAALQREFGSTPDLTTSVFVHVTRSSRILSSTPGPVLQIIRQSLLQAALQNFAAEEAFDFSSELQCANGRIIDIAPERFAAVCRTLDLGQRYQEHLRGVFETSMPAQAASKTHAQLMRCQQDALVAQAALALLQGHIDQQAHDALVAGLQFPPARHFRAHHLSIWGLALDEILLFEVLVPDSTGVQPCLVYVPGHPCGALRHYPSRSAFMLALREQLRARDYQAFFSRFVGQRNRAQYQHHIDKLFNIMSVTRRDGVAPQDIKRVRLQLVAHQIEGNLHRRCATRHVARILDDAMILAVPTAQVDAQRRLARLEHWLDVGTNVLNLAALFVPVVGVIMLPVAGAQLLGDFFHGVEAWENGETDQALGYLTGLAQNLALLGVLGALHTSIRAAPGANFADGLEKISLPHGQQRLWKPDLALYVSDTVLSPELRPNVLGQYAMGGKTWVSLDGQLYEVAFDSSVGKWRIQHPSDAGAYQPLLEHNGMGAWHFIGEKPLQWPVAKLLRRLGGVDELPDEILMGLWRASGISEARLTRVYTSQLPTPALLLDAIEAYQPGRPLASVTRYPRLTGLLQRDFPGLTVRAADELLDFAGQAERMRMLNGGRVSLRLAEGARGHLQQWRLSQALLGFYVEELANIDTLTLAIGQLEQLPGWPSQWRIDPKVRRSWRQGRFSSLVEAMPVAQREQLLPKGGDEAGALRQLLAEKLVVRRAAAARMLGMQPLQPGMRALQRLSGGRLGYPLGGAVGRLLPDTDRRLQALFPGFDAEQLRQFKAALSLLRTPLAIEVDRLEGQLQALKNNLATWAGEEGANSVSRRALADQLVDCWQRNPGPGARAYAYEGYRLSLGDLDVGTLPQVGEGFAHVTELAIHGGALDAQSDGFLRSFTGVRALVLDETDLTRLPEAVRYMPQLRELFLTDNQVVLSGSDIAHLRGLRFLQVLDLSGNGLSLNLNEETLDGLALLRGLRTLNLAGNQSVFPARAFEQIARLTQLRKLYLSGNWINLAPADVLSLSTLTELEILSLNDNPLGLAPDVSHMQNLTQLNLENTGISTLPVGLEQLQHLQSVNLSFNRLTTVPQGMERMWQFNLDGNPLAADQLQHFIERGGNYRAWREAPSSVASTDQADINAWLVDASVQQQVRWEQMQEQQSAQPFFRVLQRLSDSAEFDPAVLASRQRVWALLDAAADSEQLRDRLFALARGEETCADRAALVFSQLEVEKRVYDLQLLDLPAQEHNGRMVQLARQLFRLDEVDMAARRAINQWRLASPQVNVDDIEVLLAFRIGLARRLALPDQPASALYLRLADKVTAQLLDETAIAIGVKENTGALADWMGQQDFWAEFLRSSHGPEFNRVVQPWHLGLEYLEACLEASSDMPASVPLDVLKALVEPLQMPLKALYADGQLTRVKIDDNKYLAAANALSRSQQRSEQALLARLTLQALEMGGKDLA